jgi:hypothetical protein
MLAIFNDVSEKRATSILCSNARGISLKRLWTSTSVHRIVIERKEMFILSENSRSPDRHLHRIFLQCDRLLYLSALYNLGIWNIVFMYRKCGSYSLIIMHSLSLIDIYFRDAELRQQERALTIYRHVYWAWLYTRYGLVTGFIEMLINSWLHFTNHYQPHSRVLSHDLHSVAW